MSKLINHSQIFYSGRAALEVQLTRNGIFFIIAPSLQKNEAGNMTYNWEKKITTKFSISETILIKKALIAFFEGGTEAYKKIGLFISGNEKYSNMQFQHVTAKSEIRVGLEVYNDKISFGVFKQNGESLKYPIQNMDYWRLVEFLEYIAKQAFYYESALIEEERINAIGIGNKSEKEVSKIIPSPAPKKETQIETLETLLDVDISELSEVNKENDAKKETLALKCLELSSSLDDIRKIIKKFNGLKSRSKEYGQAIENKSQSILNSILNDVKNTISTIKDGGEVEVIKNLYSDIKNEVFQASLNEMIKARRLEIGKLIVNQNNSQMTEEKKIKDTLIKIDKMSKDEALMALTSIQVNKDNVLMKNPTLKKEVFNKLEMLQKVTA